MKTKTLILWLAIWMTNGLVQGQDNGKSEVVLRIYKVWIVTMDDFRISGYLTDIDSTGITVSNKVPKKATEYTHIPAENIKSIDMRRRGGVLKGTAIGFATGFTIGAVAASGDAEDGWLMSREDKIYLGGTVLGILGGGVGAIAGSRAKKVDIDGKLAMFQLKVPIIQEMMYRRKRK